MEQGRLVCRACSARWSTSEGGDLSLEATGERDTVAGWAGRCGELEDLSSREGPVIDATEAEWREDPQAAVTMEPLHSLGTGTAVLHADRLEWRGEGRRRDLHIGDVKTVTTERNDTLQLGVGRGVVQLVFSRSSPLRWQVHVKRLKEISDVRRPA